MYYIYHTRERDEVMKEEEKIANRKKHPVRRWTVESTNS